MIEESLYNNLTNFASSVKSQLNHIKKEKQNSFYFDRDVLEYSLLKKIMHLISPTNITVIGGYTCLDLYSSLEDNGHCNITNYDPLENKWAISDNDFKSATYVLKKYFKFSANFDLVKQKVHDINDIKISKTMMINVPGFDLRQFCNLEPAVRPELIVYSHYSKIPHLSQLVEEDLEFINDIIPLRFVTPSMLIFANNNFTNMEKCNFLQYNKSFFNIPNVHYIKDTYDKILYNLLEHIQ